VILLAPTLLFITVWMERHSSEPLRTGIHFGLTSGVITTLGLIVGLHAGTHSTLAVVGGVLTITVADACSDALGIHISEEGEHVHSPREIWQATIATLLAKFCMALTFLVPVWFCELPVAIIVSIVWGLLVITALSYQLARSQGVRPSKVIAEHLAIAVVVIILTHVLGDWVRQVLA
jgi:VIT1/CCC1 family predicted Fe2+/Mn2+ transporter